MTFTNGVATTNLRYNDAGRLSVSASYTGAGGSGAEPGAPTFRARGLAVAAQVIEAPGVIVARAEVLGAEGERAPAGVGSGAGAFGHASLPGSGRRSAHPRAMPSTAYSSACS